MFPQIPEDLGSQSPDQLRALIEQYTQAIASVVTGEAFAAMETPPTRNEVRDALSSARDNLKALKAALDEADREDTEFAAELREIAEDAGVPVEALAETPDEAATTEPEALSVEPGEGDEGDEPDPADPDPDDPEAAATEPAAVEASGDAPAPKRYSNRPAATPKRHAAVTTTAGVALTAAAGSSEFRPGVELSRDALAALTIDAIRQGVAAPPGMPFKVRLAQANWADQYPAERRLEGEDVFGDMRKLDNVRSRRAVTAAGGFCAPSPIRYDIGTLGVTDRPVRDALTAFQSTRGGLRYYPDLSIAGTDTTDGITHLTEAQDEGGTWTKDCVVVECPTDSEIRADIIAACLQAGNLASIAFPELIAAWQDLLAIATARTADGALLDHIEADPQTKVVSASSWYGGWPSVVNAFSALAAGYRSRHRLGAGDPLEALAPAWLADKLVVDFASTQTPNLEVARAQVAARIEAATGVRVTWYLDSATGDGMVFGSQGESAVLGFPNPVSIYLFPPGGILFIDQGMLNIGLIRDSALTETNDVRFFAEVFEAAAVIAAEVFKLELTFCGDGTRAPAGTLETCGATI
jgi:hypothetical protein